MKERNLVSQGQLDIALRDYNTSLDQQYRDFCDYMMGMDYARSKIGKTRYEVTHQEMIDYYREHIADYAIPAKARFEILTVKFSNVPDRTAAAQAIAAMGNEIVLGGTPFAAVARKHSQEPHAQDGGQYDWTTIGSLASKPIDRAIFALEVGKLSQIIEDDVGYHIVRVIERKEAGQLSFEEQQPEIRKAIEAQKRSADQQKFFNEIKSRAKYWTIYDPPAAAADSAAKTQP